MARVGNLWHMTNEALLGIMDCRGIVPPAEGRGTGKGNRVTKRDRIQAILKALDTEAAELDTQKKRQGPKATGLLSSMNVELTQTEMREKWGGGGDLETCIGTALPYKCLTGHGFVEGTRVYIPDVVRLQSTIVSNMVTMCAWNGADDTVTVQDLGTDQNAVDMWHVAMNRRPDPPRWSDTDARFVYEPVVVKDLWICRGENGHNYAFCLMKGLWRIGLETLFDTFPKGQRHSYPLISTLSTAVQKTTDLASHTSRAGRDTQHYAWRYEKDTYGNPWLVVGLLPLPYFFSTSEPGGRVPADKLVRSAADGAGGLYLTKLVRGKKSV